MDRAARLAARRQEILGRIDDLRDQGLGMSLKDSVQEFSSYDNHSSDLASETFEREKDLGLMGSLREQLREVAAAQERMRSGGYGSCARCGREISAERLDALPWARHCRPCQEVVDRQKEFGPPVEEETFPEGPWQHVDRDGRDEVGYDGEDAWQEVARYGNANSPQDEPPAVRVDVAYIDSAERHGAVEDVENLADGAEADPGS